MFLRSSSKVDATSMTYYGLLQLVWYRYMLLLVTFNGRSLMKMMKKSGPRIEPCGTPDVMGRDQEITPLMATFGSHPSR